MKHTIELSQEQESALVTLAKELGSARPEEALDSVVQMYLSLYARQTPRISDRLQAHILAMLEQVRAESIPVASIPDVMGGDACIRNTRIPIWMLVAYKREGLTDSAILQNFPSLNASDLSAAWDFYVANADEVERQRKRHEDAA